MTGSTTAPSDHTTGARPDTRRLLSLPRERRTSSNDSAGAGHDEPGATANFKIK